MKYNLSFYGLSERETRRGVYGTIAKNIYGYNVSVIDLRNPTRSNGNNLLHLVNKYFDLYNIGGDYCDWSKT